MGAQRAELPLEPVVSPKLFCAIELTGQPIGKGRPRFTRNQHKLPAVYFERNFVAAGGLISYGLTTSTSTDRRPTTSTASSRARNPPICQCRRRPSTIW